MHKCFKAANTWKTVHDIANIYLGAVFMQRTQQLLHINVVVKDPGHAAYPGSLKCSHTRCVPVKSLHCQ